MSVYLEAVAGGVLIGIASTVMMLGSGKIAGISGIVGQLLPPSPAKDWLWRAAFVIGLVAGPVVAYAIGLPVTIGKTPLGDMLVPVAGFLVGFGAALGNGCTSGHGVCGMARLSPRSIVATVTFMATAAITVFIVRHVISGM